MRKWDERSLYWRTVMLHTVLVSTIFSGAFLRPALAVPLLISVLAVVVVMTYRLRCPKCRCLVMVEVFKTKLWNQDLPSHCMQCQWPTDKPVPREALETL